VIEGQNKDTGPFCFPAHKKRDPGDPRFFVSPLLVGNIATQQNKWQQQRRVREDAQTWHSRRAERCPGGQFTYACLCTTRNYTCAPCKCRQRGKHPAGCRKTRRRGVRKVFTPRTPSARVCVTLNGFSSLSEVFHPAAARPFSIRPHVPMYTSVSVVPADIL
jgi:hypothetical protein